jgi:hypothetical protein
LFGRLKHGRGLLLMGAVMAIGLAGCGSSGGSKSTSGAGATPSQTVAASPSAAQTPNGEATPGASDAWANVTSYKYTMTLQVTPSANT